MVTVIGYLSLYYLVGGVFSIEVVTNWLQLTVIYIILFCLLISLLILLKWLSGSIMRVVRPHRSSTDNFQS